MLSIEISFPAGRYHATPWDRHVNEGAVEWPPSPWRLVRALIAVRALRCCTDVDDDVMSALLTSLAGTLPSYRLPTVTVGHTRHYMPTDAKPVKVLDTFVRVSQSEPLIVWWPEIEIGAAEQGALDLLLERLTYLGRAESWAEARRAEHDALAPNATPVDSTDELEEGQRSGLRRKRTRLLAPLSPAEYLRRREEIMPRLTETLLASRRAKAIERGKTPEDAQKIRLTPKQRTALEVQLPAAFESALGVDVEVLRKGGWNRPPASRWVDYQVPADLIERRRSVAPARRRKPPPTTARLAVAGKVPPHFTDCLPFAERVRKNLLGIGGPLPELNGKDDDGAPLEGHWHLHVWPEANAPGGGGYVTHVTLHSPMGFGAKARQAIDRLDRVSLRGPHDVQLILLGIGPKEAFGGPDLRAGQCPLFHESCVWSSRTPFVPTRHPKRSRDGQPKLDESGLTIGGAEHDLRRLLAERGFPPPLRVERVSHVVIGGKPTRFAAFRCFRRSGGGRRGPLGPVGFRITFPHPVSGPIALGFGAHFGLGVFVPEDV